MKEVEVIKPKKNKFDRALGKELSKIRVAPYCRVSTDSAEQMASYDSQVAYYEQKIKENPKWELAKIYFDAGISGTNIDKRLGFQEMIRDAVVGEFDLVITKSVSRFGRNTKDILEYTRLLKKHNVAVLFEEENINTFSMQGEVAMTVLTSIAQQESESISTNVKMGLKMKMKRGELIGFQGCLGYDYDKETKELVISSKHGKKHCPDSKGIHEAVIEEAFVKVFNEMCQHNREIIEEFITTIENTLSESTSKKVLSTLNKELSKVEEKIKKLIDLHIDGAIDRESYENKFINLNKDKERLIKETNELSLTASEEKEMKTRLKSFRKYFDANKPLKKFDADVFESIVEKIILGGIDDKGQKDPHQLTFVFKTGPKSTISVGKDDEAVNGKWLLKKGKMLCSQLSPDIC